MGCGCDKRANYLAAKLGLPAWLIHAAVISAGTVAAVGAILVATR